MTCFTVNGKKVYPDDEVNLLSYLRDELHLTSVKNGCMKGVCGACTVLINGKNIRACLKKASQLEGADIITVEGLSEYEKAVYEYAFGKAGAVQCGFCIPGMIMSAKALLDVNLDPSEQEVRKAIRNNLCRCTGYVKIVKGILLAAEVFREKKSVEELTVCGGSHTGVGTRTVRSDVHEKVRGLARYCDDYYMEDMLHVQLLFSEYPRAKVVSIDLSEARKVPGVRLLMTAEDIPGARVEGYLIHDWPVMIGEGEITHYVGDVIAMAAAETKQQAIEAVKKIRVKYEELQPVTSVSQSLCEQAPKLFEKGNILSHTQVSRGENRGGRLEDDPEYITVRESYHTPYTEHAFLEPESAFAYWKNDILTIHASTQDVHHLAREISNILGVEKDRIEVISKYVGGGFGGKEDLTVQAFAAMVSFVTGRPAKLTFTREESLRMHPKRHPMNIDITLVSDKKGNFQYLNAKLVADTGAYASLGPGVVQRACTHLCGPYRMPSVDLNGYAVYTNNPPSGAFRGFGVAQSAFALESTIDRLAEKLNMDYFDIRYQNILLPGDEMGTGQFCGEDTNIKEVMDAIKPYYIEAKKKGKSVGLACGIKNAGMGSGTSDIGRACLKIKGQKVILLTSAQCIGQGLDTVMFQIISEVTGIPVDQMESFGPDSLYTPDSNATTASRQTLITGEAVRRAAKSLGKVLKGKTLQELEGEQFYGEFYKRTDPVGTDIKHPYNHVAYSYAAHLAILDGQGKMEKIVAVHDVGRAINPTNVEGQIEGGVVMGIGYALTENFEVREGKIQTSFGRLGLLRADQIPEIIPILVEPNKGEYAFSAKGIGEISTVPTAPAIAAAYKAYDGIIRNSLPLEHTAYRE